MAQNTIEQTPCANVKNTANCSKVPNSVCRKCGLVAYCSKQCQQDHWHEHKSTCNSSLSKTHWKPAWSQEHRTPSFVDDGPPILHHSHNQRVEYLWGNMPAIDILQLAENEGSNYKQDLKICFAASGDLRSIIETVNNIPPFYPGHLSIFVNDFNSLVVIRSVMILLLVSLEDAGSRAIECALHLWYSAFLSNDHIDLLRTRLRPLLVVLMLYSKNRKTKSTTVLIGPGQVQMSVTYELLRAIVEMIDATHDKSKAQESRRKIVLGRTDHVHRHLFNYRQKLHRRCSLLHFRQTGVLLPFGADLSDFTVPNPILFDNGNWMLTDSADPIDGWATSQVEHHRVRSTKLKHLENDLYGGLYLFLRDKLLSFQTRLRTLNVSIDIQLGNACYFNRIFPRSSFDRIDISNIIDNCYLGLGQTLISLEGLLSVTNSHATMIGLFMNALLGAAHFAGVMRETVLETAKFLQLNPSTLNDQMHPECVRLTFCCKIFNPVEQMMNIAMKKMLLEKKSEACGMSMKKRNTIVPKWPFQALKYGQLGAKERFEELLISGQTCHERYVEWQLVRARE